MIWDETTLKEVARLWHEGYSYAYIANIYGTSRNVISSRINKMPEIFQKRKNTERLEPKDVVKLQYDYKEVPIPFNAEKIPFSKSTKFQCKWILEGFWEVTTEHSLCCGVKTLENKSYCEYHYNSSLEKKFK